VTGGFKASALYTGIVPVKPFNSRPDNLQSAAWDPALLGGAAVSEAEPWST